jgi:putative tryptophan/tyrosine transport system substrate-binding protein
MQAAAHNLGISLTGPPLDFPLREEEYRRVVTAMVREKAEALFVGDQAENFKYRKAIVELTEKGRLPAIYPFGEDVQDGGLLSYGLNLAEIGRHAAGQIDQILRGTKPGEIAYYQPTIFKLSINLKTAKALGLTIPPSLLARADEVIE